jgi:hypothetical protein
VHPPHDRRDERDSEEEKKLFERDENEWTRVKQRGGLCGPRGPIFSTCAYACASKEKKNKKRKKGNIKIK